MKGQKVTVGKGGEKGRAGGGSGMFAAVHQLPAVQLLPRNWTKSRCP